MLVGNKVDLIDQREIDYERAREFAETYKMQYIETSAKEYINVDNTFTKLTYTACSQLPGWYNDDPATNTADSDPSSSSSNSSYANASSSSHVSGGTGSGTIRLSDEAVDFSEQQGCGC